VTASRKRVGALKGPEELQTKRLVEELGIPLPANAEMPKDILSLLRIRCSLNCPCGCHNGTSGHTGPCPKYPAQEEDAMPIVTTPTDYVTRTLTGTTPMTALDLRVGLDGVPNEAKLKLSGSGSTWTLIARWEYEAPAR
jgi:hypothetical protein